MDLHADLEHDPDRRPSPADESALDASGPLGWLARWRGRLTRRASPRAEAAALVLAAAVFVVGGVLAWRALDVSFAALEWLPLVLVVVALVPATVLANALEYLVLGRMVGTRPGWRDSVRVVVVATAANLLPLPGAALVRVQALRVAGVPYRRAVVANVLTAVLWVAASCGVAGVVLGVRGRGVAAGALLVLGVVALVASMVTLVRMLGSRRQAVRATLRLTAVELGHVGVQAVRLLLVLAALQVPVDLAQTLVISASAALAASAGVFPGGLGLSESIAAGLAPLVALSAAAGFASAALNRLAGVAVIGPLSAALGIGRWRDARAPRATSD